MIYGLPPMMVYVGQGRPLGIPMPVIIFLVVAVVAHCVLAYTTFGRYTLVIGDNESAARAAGIRVEHHRRILYTLSGALAGLAGMLFMARVNSGDPTSGLNYELTAITAAIIGGTNLFGGRACDARDHDRCADHGRAAERPQPAGRPVLLPADGDRRRADPGGLASTSTSFARSQRV